MDSNKEEYNIEDYYFKIPEDKKLSRVQQTILLLIHGLLIIVIPILLITMINNLWIEMILALTWWYTLDYTSQWIQKNITNKIFKL